MQTQITAPEPDVAAASASNTERGDLLLRYARGRLTYFGSRQVLTLSGGILLGLMNGPLSGAFVILIALAGEAVDCFYLRQVPGLLEKGVGIDRLFRVSTATAAVQGASIAVCVGIAWAGEPSHEAPLFSIAFLVGASINAAMTVPYHAGAATARLSIFGGCAAITLLLEIGLDHQHEAVFAMNAAGSLILAYVVFAYATFVKGSAERTRRTHKELVEQSRVLASTVSELRAREREAQQLSLVAKNASDSVMLSRGDGRIFWTNDAFTQITGYSAEEVVGRIPIEFMHGPDTDQKTLAEVTRAIQQGTTYRGEIQRSTKDGRRIWIESNVIPMKNAADETDMIIAIGRDITASRQHALELDMARRAAEEGARAKAEFLAMMSHEIRTPMNGVIGMAELLSGSDLDQEQTEYVNTIRTSAQALLTIVNDVLDLSRLDARKMSLSEVDFDLADCLKDTVQLLRPQAHAKGLSLDLDLLAGLPRQVRADDGRLRQVLINLIGNAIKFTEHGGITIRVGAQTDQGAVQLKIEVEDTGIGIDSDNLNHIFERFSQADAATTRKFGGTGLGLTISQMLVQAMGGDISVRSQPGAGSTFTVSMPVAPPAGDLVQADSADTDVADHMAWLDGKHILVAEDNRVNRLLIEKYLGSTPLRLSFAHDGRQAVEMGQAEKPDLVLMDMSMPVMNGLDATRRIRASGGWQPVIVALTANAYGSDKAACFSAGMDGFLSKPVRRAELIACLVHHLAPAGERQVS